MPLNTPQHPQRPPEWPAQRQRERPARQASTQQGDGPLWRVRRPQLPKQLSLSQGLPNCNPLSISGFNFLINHFYFCNYSKTHIKCITLTIC